MKRILCTAIILGVLMQPAVSVVAEDAGPPRLAPVVVTATRLPAPLETVTTSVSAITEEDIANRQSQTVVDALRDVPGVDISQSGSTGSTASVFIRGADADQSLILIDGVAVNSSTLGGFNFGNIMTDDVARIEVLRGAGGTLYGSEAIGGVINILTKKGEGPPHFSLLSGGGNIGTSSQLASVAGESGIVAYSASLGYLTTGGFRPINDDFSNLTNAVRIDVTPIEHGTLRGFWRVANSSLGLANNDIGAGLGSFLDPDARERDEFYLAKGEWEHAPTKQLSYRISGSYTRTVNVFSDQANAQEQSAPSFYAPYFVAYFRVPNEIATGETQVNYAEDGVGISTVGFEFKEFSGKLKSVALDGTVDRFAHSRSNYAGYVQQQVCLFDDRFTAVGGFRVDGNQDFGREVSSSWSVGYLEDWGSGGRWNTHVKGGYSEGFRAPTFNELFYPLSGNRNLVPEVSSEYDGGLEQHVGTTWLAVDGTYFTRRTTNVIQFAPVTQCPGANVPPGVSFAGCNLGRADVRGVETGVTLGPLAGVSARGTYSYLDFDLLGGKKLLRRPHNRMATSLNYERAALLSSADRFDANVNVVFVGERTDIDPISFDPNATSAAYTRVDLALQYERPVPGHETSRIGWFARIQNLMDRKYEEVRGFPSPPVNVLAGARVTF
jgi:vitamin B12 transporter